MRSDRQFTSLARSWQASIRAESLLLTPVPVGTVGPEVTVVSVVTAVGDVLLAPAAKGAAVAPADGDGVATVGAVALAAVELAATDDAVAVAGKVVAAAPAGVPFVSTVGESTVGAVATAVETGPVITALGIGVAGCRVR
jgi:hypothetical protein